MSGDERRKADDRVADRNPAGRNRLEMFLLEGLDSGDPVEAIDEWWERKRADLARQWHRNDAH